MRGAGGADFAGLTPATPALHAADATIVPYALQLDFWLDAMLHQIRGRPS